MEEAEELEKKMSKTPAKAPASKSSSGQKSKATVSRLLKSGSKSKAPEAMASVVSPTKAVSHAVTDFSQEPRPVTSPVVPAEVKAASAQVHYSDSDQDVTNKLTVMKELLTSPGFF